VKVAFIIGSPRSGTTVLGNIFDCHEEIAEWYEPYYLWESIFDTSASNIWDPAQLTAPATERIRREYAAYAQRSGQEVVIDKSPTHVFNIPIILEVFPEAKWVHIIRDGRDVTLSISKEWRRRRELVESRDFRALVRTALTMLRRQPFWRYRLMALRHELGSRLSLHPSRYFNKKMWHGEVGWGPRYEGWQEYLATHSVLAFNASQWAESVRAARAAWSAIPDANKIEIRYEGLLQETDRVLTAVLAVLGCDCTDAFLAALPTLKTDNFNKWPIEFSADEIAEITPVLAPMLAELGYK
jgi:hypothetical protein